MTQKVSNEPDCIRKGANEHDCIRKVTEKDVDAAEHRHITNQLKRLAHYYSYWAMPKTIEECNKYNNRMLILIRRKEYLEYLLNHKEKC